MSDGQPLSYAHMFKKRIAQCGCSRQVWGSSYRIKPKKPYKDCPLKVCVTCCKEWHDHSEEIVDD